MKRLTTSIKISAVLDLKLLQKIVADGYGLRGKSKWVAEAIEGFLQMPNFPELVDIAEGNTGLSKVLSFRLSEDLASLIDAAVIKVRKTYPGMEGVKSKIVRAAVIQRLINNPMAKGR